MIEGISIVLPLFLATFSKKGYIKFCYTDNVVKKRLKLASQFLMCSKH